MNVKRNVSWLNFIEIKSEHTSKSGLDYSELHNWYLDNIGYRHNLHINGGGLTRIYI